jgi:long-chain acyl-CoA synthetase
MLINDILIEHAQRQPAIAAVITDAGSMTYGELDQAAGCIAHYLADCGFRPGERVAIHWHNSVEFVVVMLGAWRTGLIVVPINPRLKAAEIAYILEHSGARLCFSEPALAPLVNGIEVITTLPALAGSSEPLPEVDPDAPAVIMYTSGTTARPKGVVHTQRTLLQNARTAILCAIGSSERPLAISQMAHIAALACVYLPGLLQGASVVLLRTFEAGATLDAIERHRCTYTFALPACLQLVVEEQARHPRDVSSLEGMIVGGDSFPTALQRTTAQQFNAELLEGYGMTEVAPIAVNRIGAARQGSIGLPLNCMVRIVEGNGRDQEPGDPGELVVRSEGNCTGYWNDPEATAQLFEGGWLHTGDHASRGEDGYLWFHGRLKQIIIRGGSNISPQEVEEALYQHPAVLEAGVVGMPDPLFAEVPVAFVALRRGCCVPEDQLIAHGGTLLADCKVPTRIFFMDELPKGLTGKVDRRRLRDVLLAEAHSLENEPVLRV